MYRYTLLLLPLLVVLPAGAGGEKLDPKARAKALAPYLDEQTLAVLRIDLSRPDAEAVALKISETAWGPDDATDYKAQVRKWLADFTRAGGKELYLLFDIDSFLTAPLVVAPLSAEANGKEIRALLASGKFLPRSRYEPIKGAIVGGNPEALERLRRLKPEPRPYLAEAFAAAGDTSVQFLLVPTADQRRVIEEIMPVLPKEVGGGPSTILTRGIHWAAVGIQGAPKMGLNIVAQSQDAAAARKLRDWLGDALTALSQNKEVRRLFPEFDKITAGLKANVEGSRVTLKLSEQQAAAILGPLTEKARLTAGREQTANNLRQIAMAIHHHNDAHKVMPTTAIYDKQGKPLLSWRVAILPYVEQGNLYNQFKLNEPWDSPHNKKLIAQIPPIYHSPFSRKSGEGKTTYLAPVGKDTAFPPGPKGLLLPKDFPDGTSNTILVVDATDARAVYWTKPEDLPYNPKEPLAGLVSKQRQEFTAAFADGSVHTLPVTLGLDNIRALFTRNGGEVIGQPF